MSFITACHEEAKSWFPHAAHRRFVACSRGRTQSNYFRGQQSRPQPRPPVTIHHDRQRRAMSLSRSQPLTGRERKGCWSKRYQQASTSVKRKKQHQLLRPSDAFCYLLLQRPFLTAPFLLPYKLIMTRTRSLGRALRLRLSLGGTSGDLQKHRSRLVQRRNRKPLCFFRKIPDPGLYTRG